MGCERHIGWEPEDGHDWACCLRSRESASRTDGSSDGAMTNPGTDSPPAGALIISAIRFPCGGKVGMTHCPGRNHIDSSGRRWNGDLAADLRSIEAWGASALVSLIETHELAWLGVPDLAIRIGRSRLDWYHLPIRDMCAPQRSGRRSSSRLEDIAKLARRVSPTPARSRRRGRTCPGSEAIETVRLLHLLATRGLLRRLQAWRTR